MRERREESRRPLKEEGSSSRACRGKCVGKPSQFVRRSGPSSRFNSALAPISLVFIKPSSLPPTASKHSAPSTIVDRRPRT